MCKSLEEFVALFRVTLLEHLDQVDVRDELERRQAEALNPGPVDRGEAVFVVSKWRGKMDRLDAQEGRDPAPRSPLPEGNGLKSDWREWVTASVQGLSAPVINFEPTPWEVAFPMVMPHMPAGCDEDRLREYLCKMELGGLDVSDELSERFDRLDHLALAQQITRAISKKCPLAAGVANSLPQTNTAQQERGVSLHDVALFLSEGDAADATTAVRRFSNSKKIKAEPIGKCPQDGRASLYNLSEIIRDAAIVFKIRPEEQTKLRQHLLASERAPALE